jgi:hypothetical protein
LGLIVAGSATAATNVNPGGTLKKAVSEEEEEEPFEVSSGKPNQVIKVNPGWGTLKKAIEDAEDGDILELTAGTYYDHDMTIDKHLTIIGPEHTGTPTAVINAEQKGRVFDINKRMLVFLKNIAITNGRCEKDSGGGIKNYGTLTMTDCSVKNNRVTLWLSIHAVGGGICNYDRLTMTDCIVYGNTARLDGGGIYNNHIMTMNRCNVNENTAQYGYGGGIYNNNKLTMTDCNANENTSYYYGGGIYNNYRMTMNRCNVNENTAQYGYGGGIYNNNDLTMSTCKVIGNTAQNDYNGGGIYNNYTLTMSDCNVEINYTAQYGYGGGIYNNHIMTMNRCNVDNNTAPNGGGGIYNYGQVYVDQYTRYGIFNNYPNDVEGYPLETGPSGGDDNVNGNWRAVNAVSATNIPMQKTGLPLIGLLMALLLILGGLYKR